MPNKYQTYEPESSRDSVLVLCDWLEINGFFHFFDGKIIFIRYDAIDLGIDPLWAFGAPISVFSNENVADLLGACLHRHIEIRRSERKAQKWVMGLGIAITLLVLALYELVLT